MASQLLEKRLVQCGVRLPAQRLSISDMLTGTHPIRRAVAFPYRLDLPRLLTSLRASLRELPIMCGRLRETPDGLWSIDLNDAGLAYTVIEEDRAMPRYGYDHSMKPEMGRLAETLAFSPLNRDQPIVGIRVTRFRDGTVLGLTTTHALMDGSGAWRFLDRWSQHFREKPEPLALTFDRALIHSALQLDGEGARPAEAAPAVSPMSWLRGGRFILGALLSPLTGATSVFHLPAAALAAHKARLSKRLPAGEWISTQDTAMSLVVQAVAAATTHEQLQCGSIYDIRRLAGLGLSAQYTGNAAASRMFTSRSAELARDPLLVARTLRQLASTLDGGRARAELQQLAARFTPRTAMDFLPGFIGDQFSNGLLLNNYSRFPMYQADFGSGPPIWGDYPHVPMNRVITLCPDPNGDGVAVHLTLPRREMRRFVRPEGAGRGMRIAR